MQNRSNDCIIPIVFHLLVVLLAAVSFFLYRNYEKSNAEQDQATQKDLGGIIKDIANDQWLNGKAGVRILISILRILSRQNNNKRYKGGRAWKRV